MKNMRLATLSLLLPLVISTYGLTFTYDGIRYETTTMYGRVNVSSNPNAVGTITIPSSVEYSGKVYNVIGIGYEAFYGCSGLSSIVISEGVTSIGSYAFRGCSNLSSIVIPESVTSISSYAFDGCSNLSSIVIPESVTSIGLGAFNRCSKLSSIEIPKGVTSISNITFSGCSSLSSVKIPDGITSIGDYVFSECANLSSIVIPESVISIGLGAFNRCSKLSSIVIPESVTSIGDEAFGICSSLSSVKILGPAVSIGAYAFNGCSKLSKVIIPGDVISFGSYAFRACTKLSEVIIPGNVISFGSYVFERCNKISHIEISVATTLFSGCKSLSSVVISEGATAIATSAFKECPNLSSIVIPESVTSIGDEAFCGCSSLSSVKIPDGITSIGDYVFSECANLSSIVIPESVTSIGDEAFSNCSNLSSIVIPESVTSIGNEAFSGCSSLSSVKIPDGITSIGDYVFSECANLSSVVFSGSIAYIGIGTFSECTNLTSVIIPEGFTSIVDKTFFNCTSLSSIDIPNSVASIGKNAFNGCTSLSSVLMSKGITTVGYRAFYNCSNLSSIIIPEGVNVIGDYLFYGCSSLSSIEIPESVTSIGTSAFESCSGLSSVVLHEGITSIADKSFYGCSSLSSVEIPESVTSIGTSAFESCSGLSSVVLHDGITSIPDKAFYGCSSLSSVEIPGSVTTIGLSAFESCSNLSSVVIPRDISSIGEYAFNCGSYNMQVFVYSHKPINLKETVFREAARHTYRLHVPFGRIDEYTNDYNWSRCFGSIEEMAPEVGDYFTAIIPEDTSIIEVNVKVAAKTPLKVGIVSETSTASVPITTRNFVLPDFFNTSNGISFQVAEIGSGAFVGCSQMKSISIPKTVERIDKAFLSCDSLCSAFVHWRNPSNVSVDPENFDGIPNDAVLYVPAGTSKRYAEMEIWNKFSQIVELGSASLGDLYVKPGANINLPLYLNNEDPMAGMQYRLTLPEGVSPVLEEGEYLTSLTDRTKTMTIVGRKDPDNDNSYLFAMLSLEGDTVAGNKGALVNLKVEVDENVGLGEYKVELDDVMLVTSSIETFTSPKTSSFFIIKDIVMGDINEDGYIDVADLAAQVRLILGTDNINWIAYAGDMDESGEIEVNDYVALVNTALRQYQTSYMAHERALGLGGDVPSILQLSSLVIDDGEEGDLCLSLSKDSIPYTALQFDLTLPAGVSIVDEGTEAASRKHNVWYEMNTDGTYRVMCASMSNAVFADGDILCLRIKADGAKQGIHEARIDNVVLSDIEAVRYTTGAAKTNIQVGKDTGVSELYKQGLLVSVRNARLVLTAYSAQHVQIVLPNGMEVESLTMEEGEVVYRALPKGVYIVNGKKITL